MTAQKNILVGSLTHYTFNIEYKNRKLDMSNVSQVKYTLNLYTKWINSKQNKCFHEHASFISSVPHNFHIHSVPVSRALILSFSESRWKCLVVAPEWCKRKVKLLQRKCLFFFKIQNHFHRHNLATIYPHWNFSIRWNTCNIYPLKHTEGCNGYSFQWLVLNSASNVC